MKVNIEVKPKYKVGTIYQTPLGYKRTVIDIIYKVREVSTVQSYSYLVKVDLPFTATETFLKVRESEIDLAKKMQKIIKEV